MKTKKSGVRGSVITNADLEKAIKELEGVASGRVKLFGPNEYWEPVSGDGPLARALLPFDKAASGAVVKANDKTCKKFAELWFEVCGLFDRGSDLRTSFCLVWNGFVYSGSAQTCPQVFGGDYGVFRFLLSKAVGWKFYEQCGAKKDVDRIVEIEDGQKRRDMKICKALLAASEAESRAKGELTEEEICEKQERFAVGDYRHGEPLKETLIRMLKAKEINGFKIVGDAGWVGMCIEDGCVRRNELGDLIRTPKIYSSKVWRKLYQRVRRLLNGVGKRKKKGNRISRKNRA